MGAGRFSHNISKCRWGLFPSLSPWYVTRHTEGVSKGWPERINLEELSLPSSPRCDAAEALRGQFFSLILFTEISAF